MRVIWLAVPAVLALGLRGGMGCSSDSTTTCSAGDVLSCDCPDGRRSTSACLGDGSGFAACRCGDGSSSSTSTSTTTTTSTTTSTSAHMATSQASTTSGPLTTSTSSAGGGLGGGGGSISSARGSGGSGLGGFGGFGGMGAMGGMGDMGGMGGMGGVGGAGAAGGGRGGGGAGGKGSGGGTGGTGGAPCVPASSSSSSGSGGAGAGPCIACSQMQDPFDAIAAHACPGPDATDYASFAACACTCAGAGQRACAAACDAYCKGGPLDATCSACLGGPSACPTQLAACAADVPNNGCTLANAEDHTGDANVTIVFGGANPGHKYSPRCIHIAPGAQVTWSGNFLSHPLQNGWVNLVHTKMTPQPGSPIVPTASGNSVTFTFPSPGTFGFYCHNHWTMDMDGAVIVQ